MSLVITPLGVAGEASTASLRVVSIMEVPRRVRSNAPVPGSGTGSTTM